LKCWSEHWFYGAVFVAGIVLRPYLAVKPALGDKAPASEHYRCRSLVSGDDGEELGRRGVIRRLEFLLTGRELGVEWYSMVLLSMVML
jgi:hypothetical protein